MHVSILLFVFLPTEEAFDDSKLFNYWSFSQERNLSEFWCPLFMKIWFLSDPRCTHIPLMRREELWTSIELAVRWKERICSGSRVSTRIITESCRVGTVEEWARVFDGTSKNLCEWQNCTSCWLQTLVQKWR